MRRTLRPSTDKTLTLIAVVITLVLSAIVLLASVLGRTHLGRVALAAASGAVFLFFMIGWATVDVN